MLLKRQELNSGWMQYYLGLLFIAMEKISGVDMILSSLDNAGIVLIST